MIVKEKKTYSYSEYIDIEQELNEKHDFYFGELFNMAGGTIRHNILSNRLHFLLETRRKENCLILSGDVKLELIANQFYVYPDVMLTCDKTDFQDGTKVFIQNPSLIIEVLSTSTEDYEQRKKNAYFQIASLQYYILVSQDKISISLYDRKRDFFKLTYHKDINDILNLEKLGIELKLSDIYKNIDLK